MARPTKATVDYFPHDTKHGKTIFILKSKYGNDGYAAWFQILEILGHTEGHQFDCSAPENQEYLSAYLLVDWQKCCDILDTLSKLGAIDADLWSQKLIWSDNFMSRISEAYKKRTALPPDKPQFKTVSGGGNSISGDGNPQSKVKKIKEKEISAKESALRDTEARLFELAKKLDNEKSSLLEARKAPEDSLPVSNALKTLLGPQLLPPGAQPPH